MIGAIIKVIIGLFIWMVLPRLIYNKRKYQQNTPQYFVSISCKIIGISIIAFAVLNFVRSILTL
jgi:uncharacterized membrane-anchored protein YhcB (DUF1043 family)